jgi:hypothetical protein
MLINFHIGGLSPISRALTGTMRASAPAIGMDGPEPIGNGIAGGAIILSQKGVTQLTLGLKKREHISMPVVMGGPGSAILMTEEV